MLKALMSVACLRWITLNTLSRRHIWLGKQVLCDCWAGYSTAVLEANGYNYLTANHNETSVHLIHGTHTNTIEGILAGNKRNSPREWVHSGLLKCIWKRKHKDELLARLLHAMVTVVYKNDDACGEAVANVPLTAADYDAEL